MKKFMAVLIAMMIAMTTSICLIPSFAGQAITGPDLLEESGIGDPEFLYEEGVNVADGSWLGHEDWNGAKGWIGFYDGTDPWGNGCGTREVVNDVVLSDGSKGCALRFANDSDKVSGAQNGIENIDLICGFEKGKSYQAVVTLKVSGDACNGHNTFIGWNTTECSQHSIPSISVPHDGQWHTFKSLVYTYTDDTITDEAKKAELDHGTYLEIGFGGDWLSPGYEMLIESVKVYEVAEDGFVFNLYAEDISLAGDTWPDHPEQYGDAPFTLAGILAASYGGASVDATRTKVFTALSDGLNGQAIRFAQDGTSTDTYSGGGNYLCNVPALKNSTEYTLRVKMKVKECNAGANIREYQIGLNGVTEDAKTKATADNQWHTYYYTFKTVDNAKDIVYDVVLGCDPGSPFFLEGFEVLIENVALVEGKEFPDEEDVPTGDTAIIAAIVLSVALLGAVVFTKKKVSA